MFESFEHDKIGKLVGKLDTGNSSKASVIHADNMDIKGGRVSWEIFGKKLNNKSGL